MNPITGRSGGTRAVCNWCDQQKAKMTEAELADVDSQGNVYGLICPKVNGSLFRKLDERIATFEMNEVWEQWRRSCTIPVPRPLMGPISEFPPSRATRYRFIDKDLDVYALQTFALVQLLWDTEGNLIGMESLD